MTEPAGHLGEFWRSRFSEDSSLCSPTVNLQIKILSSYFTGLLKGSDEGVTVDNGL